VSVTAGLPLGCPAAAQTSVRPPLRDRGPRQRQPLDRSRGSCFIWRAGSPTLRWPPRFPGVGALDPMRAAYACLSIGIAGISYGQEVKGRCAKKPL
jgi:hypothetical protein